jgi:hypothetical protein
MCEAVPPLPNTPSWRGAQLGGAKGQLHLYLYLTHDAREYICFHASAFKLGGFLFVASLSPLPDSSCWGFPKVTGV